MFHIYDLYRVARKSVPVSHKSIPALLQYATLSKVPLRDDVIGASNNSVATVSRFLTETHLRYRFFTVLICTKFERTSVLKKWEIILKLLQYKKASPKIK